MLQGAGPPESVVLSELATGLPTGALLTEADQLASYRRDEARFVPAGDPVAVVRATSTEDVVHVLRVASAHRVPVVPRGAGSGLSGGANAVDGSIVLSLAGMDRILELNQADRLAVVEPGVVNRDLRRACADVGLFYPPDPSSYEFSTIGGNAATNAGGLCCLKYGVTRDWVLGLRVVLADGSVADLGRRTRKGVAGYDLTGLFVGSEGTLGVITQVTVRLRALPAPPLTAVATFESLQAAGVAVDAVLSSGQVPALLEIMDQTTIRAVDDLTRMDLDRDAAALLLAQSDSAEPAADLAEIGRIWTAAGAREVFVATDAAEGEALLAARRAALPALGRLGTALLDDVAVTPSKLVELCARIESIAARHNLLIGTFGHAGDGNLHPTVVYDETDPAQVAAAQDAFTDIVRAALELGGTSTGEHGVGLLKRALLLEELDAASLELHRKVKAALDPQGLLNPGKVL